MQFGTFSPPFLILGNIGPTELIVILMIGLLLFGRRLPDVGRSLGKTIIEFKKGLRGFENQVHAIDEQTDRLAEESAEKDRLEAQRAKENSPAEAEEAASAPATAAAAPDQKPAEPGSTGT